MVKLSVQSLAISPPFLHDHTLFVTTGDGELFAFDTQGKGTLEATRTARPVSRHRLPSGSGACPVFAGKDLVHRAADKLVCIGE